MPQKGLIFHAVHYTYVTNIHRMLHETGNEACYFRFCPLLLYWRHKDYAAIKETKRKINRKDTRDSNAKSDYTLEHKR